MVERSVTASREYHLRWNLCQLIKEALRVYTSPSGALFDVSYPRRKKIIATGAGYVFGAFLTWMKRSGWLIPA
jgi:hypothetical protein